MFRLCISRMARPDAASMCSRPAAISARRLSSINQRLIRIEKNASLRSTTMPMTLQSMRFASSQLSEDAEPEQKTTKQILSRLEKAFAKYENISHSTERTNEANLARTFNVFTQCVEDLEANNAMDDNVKSNLSLMISILLRSCGSLMVDTSPKGRELLAGNLWQYMKEKNIPADISHYNILIRVLNENKTNFDPQKILEEINAASLVPDRVTYQRLIHQYCLQGNINGATDLLDKMKELGLELNEVLFASLLIGYSNQENPPAVTEMFDLMKSNGIEPNSRSYAAAITSRANLLKAKPEQIEEFKTILSLLETSDIVFALEEIEEIVSALAPHRGNETIESIYRYVIDKVGRSSASEYRTLSALLKAGDYEAASTMFWRKRTTSRKYAPMTNFYIRLLTSHDGIPSEHVIDECFRLVESNLNDKAFFHLYYFAATNKRYELIQASLDKIKETSEFKCQYCWPLLAQTKDLDKVISILKNDLSPEMPREDLLETFVDWVWPHFSEDFKKLFELNNREFKYDNSLLVYSLIKYGAKEEKIDSVIKFITDELPSLVKVEESDTSEKTSGEGKTLSPRKSSDLSAGIGRFLLTQIVEQIKDPEIVEKVFKACTSQGSTGISNLSLTALVKSYLLKDDFKSAMAKFRELAKEYRSTPCKADLMRYCLDNKDAESLQEIMNISTAIHGEQNSLFDLAVCCLRGGHLKQAQKIFATGVRVAPYRVFDTCQVLARYEKVEVLETFVEFSSTMVDIDKEALYDQLINCYRRNSTPERLLNLWNKMQEEQFAPSKRVMNRIANTLEQNNIPVPFTKPVNIK